MFRFSCLQIYRMFGKLIVEKIYNEIKKFKNLIDDPQINQSHT